VNSGLGLCPAFGTGFVAGLNTMTASAVVAWAPHLGWINLSGTALSFVGSAWAVGIFTVGALVEFVAAIAIPEDVIVAGFGLLCVSCF
jgi:uncharacterized membrane protein